MKTKKVISIVALILVVCMLLPFAACAIQVDGIEISQATLTVNVGETKTLTAMVMPKDAPQDVSWQSSDTAIATVDVNGNVEGISEGTAQISASAGGKSAQCTVTVVDPGKAVEVQSVTVNPSTLKLQLNSVATLSASVLPLNAPQTVTWSSSNTAVATVDQSGVVTAIADGIVSIYATAVGGKQAACVVTCGEGVVISAVTVTPATVSLNIGQTSQLSATVTPAEASQTVQWTTENQTVVTVDETGLITAQGIGTASVIATAADGATTGACSVTVSDVAVTGIELDPENLELTLGGASRQISVIYQPDNAVPKSVVFESQNNGIASVDEAGMVSAVAVGSTTINVTVDDKFHATCAVTVSDSSGPVGTPVTSVTLDEDEINLAPNETKQLTATIQPEDATEKGLVWSSDRTAVARVSQKGLVTARSAGTAIIKVTSADGQHSAQCTVHVVTKVTGVTLNHSSMELGVGETQQIQAVVSPATATNKAVNWSSESEQIASVEDGYITGHRAGSTKITVTTVDGEYTAQCNVTVVIKSDTLFVSKIQSLVDRQNDFIMGMDASAVPSLEKARAVNNLGYKNFEGKVDDVFQILKDNGITDIRIRVWNNPKDANGNWYGGGNCDIENAVEISKRCQKVGLGVIIDFHYSDFWADPGKQKAPKAWASIATSKRGEEIYKYTKESLEKIKATNVKITMVQVGNEINGGLAGVTDWSKDASTICGYINQGAKAVREVTGTLANGGAKVAVHFANPEANNSSFAKTLATYSVDYDVFGSSYYPQWHGTLLNLANQLKTVHNNYNKEVMVLETSWAFTNSDFDGCGNTSLSRTGPEVTLPAVSVQGQANHVHDVIQTVSDLGEWGIGICYWEGTWIAASNTSNATTNRNLCKQYGCGWASATAKSYDSSANDGGCVIDNQAFWRSDGTPVESLKVFALVKTGNALPPKADSIEDTEAYYTVNKGPIELPSTVNVTLNTGAVIAVSAQWNVTQEQLNQYITQVGTHTITGTTTYGGTAKFIVWVMNPNLLEAGSFEEDEGITAYPQTDNLVQVGGLGPWRFDYKGNTSALQLYASNESQNARMGTQSFHFWDQAAANFTLYQTVDLDKLTEYGNGKYSASFDFQGDLGVDVDIHAYIKVTYNDGTEAKTFAGTPETEFKGWENWQRVTVSTDDLDLSKIASIEVGISVQAQPSNAEEGDYPWGNIDNAQFYSDH